MLHIMHHVIFQIIFSKDVLEFSEQGLGERVQTAFNGIVLDAVSAREMGLQNGRLGSWHGSVVGQARVQQIVASVASSVEI
jgi:hypothetical protein